jgi:hypothetical protein
MARQFSLCEIIPPVGMLKPAADSAGRTSQYVFVGLADKLYLVCYINQGNAATVALTPLQATSVAGAGSKGLTAACNIWFCEDEESSDQFVKQTAATSFTTDAGTQSKIVVFEISPQDCMDMVNGFNCIAIETGASNAANITSAQALPLHRYQQATPPSILSEP